MPQMCNLRNCRTKNVTVASSKKKKNVTVAGP